ncbi:hypothetical protein F4781DRAFT_426725 [Annulohypoxylon bovei var. microspora]|nr:hypothetical protein F4781DRAFT_426725 [Annulohypoxylon bovei var. microspora]
MAYRGIIPVSSNLLFFPSQAFISCFLFLLLTSYFLSLNFNPASVYNRPPFSNPWARPFGPAISTPLDLHQQQYPNYQLPPLPDLFAERQFSGPFDSYQQLPSFTTLHRHYNPSTPSTNIYPNQERPSWTAASPGSAFPRLDSGHRRLTSVNYLQHHSVAPPRNQQSRSSSSVIQNTHAQQQLPQPNRSVPESNGDDYYLAALADGEFSSPSLPPINSSPRLPTRPQSSNLPKPLEIGEAMPSHTRVQRTSKGRLVDLTKEEPDSTTGIDPTTLTMPPTRKRTAAAAHGDTRAVDSKRRRSSASSPTSGRVNRSKLKQGSDASPFIDDESLCGPTSDDVHETIDLSNAADVPDNLLANKCDNRMKIGKFQCVICMDDTSHLTVTHCGHLFCSGCLHSALHIDNMKKTCPVCRTKVDPKEKKGKNQKSYYHLELKIMTANKKGKQPAGLP